MSDNSSFGKVLNEMLNSFKDFTDTEYTNELKKIHLIISELDLLNSEGDISISDSDSKAFVENLSPTQLDFFSRVVNINTSLGLMLEAKNIYIKILQKAMSNIDLLDNISKKTAEKKHELNVQIVSHEKLLQKERDDISRRSRFAANKKHEPKNNAKNEIKKIWVSGKYTSKDICAEQECAALGLSFSTARKALRNL